jgi:hypothetical protein
MEPGHPSGIHQLSPTEFVELLISRRSIERRWPHFRDKMRAHRIVLRDLQSGKMYVVLTPSRSEDVESVEAAW